MDTDIKQMKNSCPYLFKMDTDIQIGYQKYGYKYEYKSDNKIL